MIAAVVLWSLMALSAGGPMPARPFPEEVGGFRDPILNIVGGSDARPGEFPWQLMLKRDSSYICGAVLVSPYKAITAAHCLSQGYTFSVVAGEHRPGVNEDEVEVQVEKFTNHPSYSEGSGYPNDIATLVLSEPIYEDWHIKPIEMAASDESDFAGTTCIISGFGLLKGDGDLPEVLQYVDIKAITNSECSSRWFFIPGASINNGHICVYESSKSSCSGDSGGPMVCGGKLAGITSWGISSCSGAFPSVYSRVSFFRDWIDAN